MQAGRLKNRILVQKRVNEQEEGFLFENYVDLMEVWAEIKDLSVKELINAQQVQNKVTTRIIVRYSKIWEQPNLRIIYKDKIYSVLEALNDPNMDNVYLTLMCSRLASKDLI